MSKPKPVFVPTEKQLECGGKDAGVLERFIKEFFPFAELVKAGFFTKEMRGNYYAQAERVCNWFGYKSVFEYGAKEIRCHITYADGKRPANTPFVEVQESIYAD